MREILPVLNGWYAAGAPFGLATVVAVSRSTPRDPGAAMAVGPDDDVVGSVSGDPTAWHADRGIVRLCSRLTWLLALPCIVRVVVQGPIYLAGRNGWWSTDSAVAALGVAKLAMGWPLQVAALALPEAVAIGIVAQVDELGGRYVEAFT